MKRLAVIPARGGSKRIPRKNIRDFAGRPIIGWSIATALDSGLFDTVMVSTDDAEIAALAEVGGASVPFLRSAATSDDHATLVQVMAEVIAAYADQGRAFDAVCCILPTAPLLTAARLIQGAEMFASGGFDSVFALVAFAAPVQRALRRDADGMASMLQPEHYASRSQDLEPAYHDAGQFYWASVETWLSGAPVFSGRAGTIVLDPMEAQDIDTEADWQLAELKHLRRTNPR
ncbi:pseudaminic acid cytidylyltransferase [Brevundimonas sp.]|uniref:pseudaminic acid cytidylyltransferase n=1 Tax=Brevundimonas sp. TaxID=1871086 RepID=UPI002AB873D9|nr:pseudaminic acid cytidylyltransferase [Brevundimonas sp.]MDZ4363646.1 pseudaminic acid cytidylyltransferase [Brevundimonas sp.]